MQAKSAWPAMITVDGYGHR